MFINLSNHPLMKWESKQLEAAAMYGAVQDLPFPNIHPEWSTENIREQVELYYHKIEVMLEGEVSSSVIHLTGEPVFCFMLANRLLRAGYKVVASTTERNVVEQDGKKVSVFNFIQFREYQL